MIKRTHSPYKMKGYSYPGISPLEDVKPTKYTRTESKKPPYFEEKLEKEYEIINDQIVYTSPDVDKHTGEDLPKMPSKSKVKKPTVVERLASSKLGKNIKGLAEGPVGEAVISSLATRALSRKEKEEPTRIISGDWKIM